MKGRRTALVSTSTGHGRAKSNHSQNNSKNNSHHQSKFGKTEQKSENKNVFCEQAEQHDEDLNSGFGDYLRSPEAIEMMKLFVFANSFMLILTMAWPNIKEQYYMFMHWWFQR